ncbi:amino acid permease like integral membrane plus 11 transmembrane domain [Cryptosporidium bovis]|uniref:amino acid permease like integral membrane plus 11 transmembrane domain n=1 Tax=Cryptosporidium bovis TaxID=310047 RepID=UPI00351A6078|nr:amino acid permease like integral membrane plus 11 transmembrane domain [Cryptosporidium bovis]
MSHHNNNGRSLLISVLLTVASSASIGCFFIPAAYKNVGVLVGILVSLLVGAFSVSSMKILARASVKTGAESYGALLYYAYSDEVNNSLLNKDGSSKTMFTLPRVFDIFVFLDCLFCVPIFILILSNLLTQILPFISSYNNYLFMFGSKTGMISITCLVLLPICIPIKYFNWIGIAFVTMFSILFCFYIILNNLYGFISKNTIDLLINRIIFYPEKEYTLKSIFNYISLFNICIFTFFSQFNIIPAASKLYNPSNFRIRLLTAFTGIILVFSYSFISIISYVLYGDATKEFILDNFSFVSHISLIARILVALSMFLLLPLHIYPMVDALTNVIDNNYIEQINKSNISESSLPLINKKEGNKCNVKKISFIRTKSGRILLLSVILILSYLISIYFRENPSYLIVMAAGFIDSIFVFLFPTLIHYRLVKSEDERFTSSPLRMALLLLFLISISGSINCLLNVLNFY